MKKLLVTALIAAMSISVLAGYGSDDKKTDDTTDNNKI